MPPGPAGILRILLIWGVALLAATWLAATAVGSIAKDVAPETALKLSPRNGFAYQQRALDHAAASGSLRKLRVPAADVALAREALRREPLAAEAVSLIALGDASAGKRDRARRLFLLANRINKREQIANIWLIEDNRVAGRAREVLNLIDDAIKVRPALADQFLPALAQGLTQPGTVPFFRAMLLQHPDWKTRFWGAVADNPAALTNAAELRDRMLRRGEKPGEIDRVLLGAFVRAGRFDLVMSSARHLAPRDPSGELVRDPVFAGANAFPPLDWELRTDGRIGAAVHGSSGTLEINALPGAGGLVARQLIEVPPGDYVLRAKLGVARLSSGSELVVRLACAANGTVVPPLVERMTGDIETRFVAAEAECRYRWLDIGISAIDATGPVMARLAEVRIVPQ